MLIFHHTYQTPMENLAIDEFLLKEVDQGKYPSGICRLWEASDYFVVLGLSKTIQNDVFYNRCKKDTIPVLKRCSGGGTVLQGPGCFNYSYILPKSFNAELDQLSSTTTFILSLVQRNLKQLNITAEQKGISDLVINNIKFSGNAQRRLKKSILFHGTLLYNFDLDKISLYLKNPPVQPEYRKLRSHKKFIRNIPTTQHDLINAFTHHQFEKLTADTIDIPIEVLNKYIHL